MPLTRELFVPLNSLKDQQLDLSYMPSKRFRLLKIESFIKNNVLELVSSNDLCEIKYKYAAISYPWQGLELENTLPAVTQFTIKGAESGGVISTDVLLTSCRAAQHLKQAEHNRPSWIWLDRLCIKQEDEEDKRWQIKHMYDIYKRCALCLVLPGGLRRLAELGEQTAWAKRAWTLQEALVPDHVECLFSWRKPAMIMCQNCDQVVVIEPFRSAALSLEGLLNAVMTGQTYTLAKPGDDDCGNGFHVSAENKDENDISPETPSLSKVQDLKIEDPQTDEIVDDEGSEWEDEDEEETQDVEEIIREKPNTLLSTEAHVLYNVLMHRESDRDVREAALWKCALMRTSSRPVDMVLSVMALFGISLNPASFKHNDREKATLALVQGILQNGGRATWLGLSLTMEPSPYMSIFPTFPETTVAGGAMIQTPTGPQSVTNMVDSWWVLTKALTGSMDADGYFHTRSRAAALKKVERLPKNQGCVITEYQIMGRGAEEWVIEPRSDIGGQYYAIIIGERLPLAPPGASTFAYANPVVLMIIQRHGTEPNRYDRKAFAGTTRKFVKGWQKLDFYVGGPEGLREHLKGGGL